ncbi:MAG: T9SS type A sorting domain-containing protein [Tannerella sp.]|jgi:YD repeat-containing protein|nr:T9SS type A sorting domain-containing protein [Tannerella sp.]
MKKKVFYAMMVCALLAAGQAQADDRVYLPTTVFRESAYDYRQKFEYAYDEFGHIVSEKWSTDVAGTYVPDREFIRAYHRLPNGEFVPTMEENADKSVSGMKERYSAAYDDRGMELWNQYEHEVSGEWKVYARREAVLNANGIRTAIRTLNAETGEMETIPAYTFDDRGRTTQVTDSYGKTYTFTWNDKDLLTGFSGPEEGTFHNVVIVVNEEYFNPYALDPLLERNKPAGGGYAWNDYTLHEWLFSADGDRMTVRATVDKARGETTQTVSAEGVEMIKIVYKTGANGSYSITRTEYGEEGTYTDERERIYDEHGALIKEYNEESDTGNGYHREDVWIYERTYDAEGRPLQTVCIHNGETTYTETYEAWAGVMPTGMEEMPVLPDIEVYPNPVADAVVIDGAPEGSTLAVFELSGRLVYRQTNVGGRQTVSVASWPKGMYLVTVQTAGRIVTRKTVKK